jgi:membrane-bound metal-dependent hydrolase YbcI (DUF457 family)
MDTITHGIAGALIGKALFRGDDLLVRRPMNRQRVVTWATMLGAIFPDGDVFRDMLSHNDLLVITWHRSVTHSLLCLPLFALLLAAITYWFARWRRWQTPSFVALTGIYAAGILSHILLDLVTTFGTMIWSPLKWSRPAWDLIFIVDFTFTGILLVPQFLPWIQERPDKSLRRALTSLAVGVIAIFAIQALGNSVGAPISSPAVFLFDVILATIFLLPLRVKNQISPRTSAKNSGSKLRGDARVSQRHLEKLEGGSFSDEKPRELPDQPSVIRRRWNLAGLAAACGYLGMAIFAHHAALVRVKYFAEIQKLHVQTLGALPWPPSLWRWDGLVRTDRGIYEVRLDLSQKSPFESSLDGNPVERPAVEYRFYPEAYPNPYITAAKELPAVQKVLWFDRFPVTHYHLEQGEPVVEISDLRFSQINRKHAAPFTYQVRFDPTGKVLSQGFLK